MDSTFVSDWSKFGMDKINDLIDVVKMTAPKLWEIYLRQVTIEGWLMFVVPIVFFVIGVILSIFTYRVGVRNQTNKYWRDSDGAFFGIALGFTIIAFLITVSIGINGLMQILNPEYYAIQSILGR